MTRGAGPGSFATPARGAFGDRARVSPRSKRTPPSRAGRRSACLRAVLWSCSSAVSTSLGLRRGGWGACGRGGAARRREDHLHHTFSETRGAEVAMRPRASRPRWASLEVAGDGSAYYWGVVLAGSVGGRPRHQCDAEDAQRRRGGGGHTYGCEGAIAKRIMGLVKRGAVE
jgi:hypothetical protein